MTTQEETTSSNHPRLQKFLAAAGLGSRRACEELITEGRVVVDREIVIDLGTRVDPERQTVEVDGEIVRAQQKKYYLLNKPAGYVCTNKDPAGRPKAVDLAPDSETRLFTVGRLDENSTGLILVTNDGELAHRLAHPKFHVRRRYRVHVAGKPTPEVLQQLRDGVYFSDGKFRVSHVKAIRTANNSTFLELELKQGRNREIRRLLAKVGHKVMSLERVVFGPLKLGSLGLGKNRPLRPAETQALQELMDSAPQTTRKSRNAGKKSRKRRTSTKGGNPRRKSKPARRRG